MADFYKWQIQNLQEISCGELNQNQLIKIKLIILGCRKEYPLFPEKKRCYFNSSMLAVRSSGRIKYCEGHLLINGVITEHAWCQMDGIFFDPTLLFNSYDSQVPLEYFGYVVPSEFVDELCVDSDGDTNGVPCLFEVALKDRGLDIERCKERRKAIERGV